ncbi:MAG: 4-hydroxymandelate oxidase [Chloroflexota bacterium]|jgi:4-hydroxymandelate oxidase|nr:4-hydroxymandelate oxidase [Chloroflexota bacterium]
MAQDPEPSSEPRSVLLARDLTPDPRVLDVHAVADFEALARERMHPSAYDYVAGGSWDEVSIAESEAAWRRYRLRPRVLVDVSRIQLSTTLLGMHSAFPAATAPMATHGLAHPDGEVATARAAAAAALPFTLSTMSSRSIEDVGEAAPEGTNWFQLYVQAEPAQSRRLVERAAAAGFKAIILTVDLPILGYRVRDRRNRWDQSVPLGNFDGEIGTGAAPSHRPDTARRGVVDPLSTLGTLVWSDLAEIRSWSRLPLVLKGILTAEDARLAVEHGADAIVVSNHGARQLDRAVAPVDVLEEVVAAVDGRAEVWVDGGVRRGLDIAIALALGARGVLVGRPILWALAAGGQAGVERALAILREEFEIALSLLGTPTPADIMRSHVAR